MIPADSPYYFIFDVFDIEGKDVIGSYVINLPPEEMVISIGRNNKNDIVFKDISVSR